MEISELIKKLQEFKEEFGNVDVYTWDGDDSCLSPIIEVYKDKIEDEAICYLGFSC